MELARANLYKRVRGHLCTRPWCAWVYCMDGQPMVPIGPVPGAHGLAHHESHASSSFGMVSSSMVVYFNTLSLLLLSPQPLPPFLISLSLLPPPASQ